MTTRTIQTLLAVVLIGGIAPLGATPDVKGTYPTAKSVRQIHKLQTGDHYLLTCDVCHSVTAVEIKGHADVTALCHDGGRVHCGSCKKRAFVKVTNPSGKFGISGARVSYVNAEGYECMHLVPLK